MQAAAAGDLAARVAALELARAAARGPGSPLLPFLLGCLVTTGFLAAAIAALVTTYVRRHRQRVRLLASASLAAADEGCVRRLLGDALPAWATAPDSARVEWMNTLTEQLWPHAEAAACKLLLKDGLLEGLLNGTTFWRPALLMGAHIGVQAVVLGQEPPRVTGLKVFAQPRERGGQAEALLEASFAWASKMEVKLLVTLLGALRKGGLRAALSRASRIKVGVSNLVARGTLRIALKPLLDELPVAGGFKASFMGAPEFTYDVSALGGNPYLLPGVEQLVASFVRENVLKPFTFPDGFSYSLAGVAPPAWEAPQGLLEVTVVGATNVPRMDLLGKARLGGADPYVKLWLREGFKYRTATRSRTLAPSWQESFTLLVHAPAHQELHLALYDSDLWRPDDLVGRVSLPLGSLDLAPGALNDLWLEVCRDGGKRGYGPAAAALREEQPQRQRVQASRVLGGADGQLAAREDTAARLAAISGGSGGRPPSPAGTDASPRSSPRSLERLSDGLQQMRQLAASPLEALRRQPCLLHIQASYLPLTADEVAALAREAGRQQGGGEAHLVSRTSTLGSPRVAKLLRSGVLVAYLDRAQGLASSAVQGFRRMRVKVLVGGLKKSTERGKVPFRHRSNPVFDESLEVIVDGDTARQRDLQVAVELWADRWLRGPAFKGRVSVPLRQVMERRRLRDTWPLSGGQGTLTMELSWMGALAL